MVFGFGSAVEVVVRLVLFFPFTPSLVLLLLPLWLRATETLSSKCGDCRAKLTPVTDLYF